MLFKLSPRVTRAVFSLVLAETHVSDVRRWFDELAKSETKRGGNIGRGRKSNQPIEREGGGGQKSTKEDAEKTLKTSEVVSRRIASKFQIYLLSLRSYKRELSEVFPQSLKLRNFINWRRPRSVSPLFASLRVGTMIVVCLRFSHFTS